MILFSCRVAVQFNSIELNGILFYRTENKPKMSKSGEINFCADRTSWKSNYLGSSSDHRHIENVVVEVVRNHNHNHNILYYVVTIFSQLNSMERLMHAKGGGLQIVQYVRGIEPNKTIQSINSINTL